MIYLNDSYIKEFHAPIVAVEEEKIITADSCFYAQSGGQPGDRGVVEINGQKVNVINTIKHEKGIPQRAVEKNRHSPKKRGVALASVGWTAVLQEEP